MRLQVRCAVLLAVCFGCATCIGVVAAEDASPWSEDADLDGIDEYLMESPKLVEQFLQVAMREIRAGAGWNASAEQSRMIFPGGELHDRALRNGAERGMLRLGGPLFVEAPALGGVSPRARVGAGSAMGVGNATGGGDRDDGEDERTGTELDDDDDDDDHLKDDDLTPYVANANAWGSGDSLGGLFVSEGDDDDVTSGRHGVDSWDDTEAASTDQIAPASSQRRRARRAAMVGVEILSGAVANTGALLPPNEWADHAAEKMSALEVPWLVGVELAEKRVQDDPVLARNETAMDEKYGKMLDWFLEKGGTMNGVAVDVIDGKPGDRRGLRATTTIHTNFAYLKVPASLTLSSVSSRNLRSAHHNVGEQLKSYHATHPENALAVLLLHEWLKEHLGTGSAWGPYLRTLHHPALGKATLRAMAGTYAAEVHAEYIKDAIAAADTIQSDLCLRASGLCARKPGETGTGTHTRDDFRWALGIVRARAVWVTKRTTGGKFLALVPFLDLVTHHADAGGETVLELDSAILVTAGGLAKPGAEMAIAKGTSGGVTDAESFCRWHHITPGINRGGGVRLKLPGSDVTGATVGKKVFLLRQWRKEMAMPPRGADLWRSAAALGMYGDGDEELELMKATNSQSKRSGRGDGWMALAPNGEAGLTVEEELMLTGQARTGKEAAATAAAFVGLSSVPFFDINETQKKPMLYAAPDRDEPGGDDPILENARKDLARYALQTQAAAALGEYGDGDDDDDGDDSDDEKEKETQSGQKERGDAKPRSDGGAAAAEALGAARDFFKSGVPPPRGLDVLDLFLLRKSRLMAVCGAPTEYLLRADGPSDALLCATRVSLANETEVAALEGMGGDIPSWDAAPPSVQSPENENALSFSALSPLSASNERASLRRLATAATNVLLSYRTSETEDLRVLDGEDPDVLGDPPIDVDAERSASEQTDLSSKQMPTFLRTKGGAVRAAVAARLREKRLLKAAMFALVRLEADIDGLKFQVDQAAALRVKQTQELRRRKKRADELFELYFSPLTLATLTVEVVQSETGASADRPVGSRYTATAVVMEGDSIETVARAFAHTHALDERDVQTLVDALQPGTASRVAHLQNATRPALVAAVPVVVPSGGYGVFVFRTGDDLTDIAFVFAGMHQVPEFKIPGLIADVNKTLVAREKHAVVLRVPVTAPDGRTVVLEIRDGDQHGDLPRFVERWCVAERVPLDTIGQIVQVARQRLDQEIGPVLVTFPVGAAGRLAVAIEIRTADPQKVLATVSAFCVTHDLGTESAPGITRTALARLDPGAVLVDADPTPKQAKDGAV